VGRPAADGVVVRRDVVLAVLVADDERNRVGLDDEVVDQALDLLLRPGRRRLVVVADREEV
jgi:hypothetical protein